jgi:hypothetical protein
MLFDIPTNFAQQDYHSLIGDLNKLARQADDLAQKIAREPPQKVATARAALPRPARVRGRGAPSARRAAWLSAARRALASNLKTLITSWTEDRFNVDKYRNLIGAAESDETMLGTAVRSVAWVGDRLLLEHAADPGYWTFDLSEREPEVVANAMGWVGRVVGSALFATERARAAPDGHFARLVRAFFFRGKPITSQLQVVDSVYHRVHALLLSHPSQIVLCKAVSFGARSRSSEAFVKPESIDKGARVFLGPGFFEPHIKYDGTERWLFRAGTLLHEFSHLVANTEDVAGDDSYGRVNCWSLDPARQRNNADNYGLFAFEAARSMIMEAGQRLPPDTVLGLDHVGALIKVAL